MTARPQEVGSVVCTDAAQAVEEAASGKDVVVVLAEGESLGSRPPGPGRLAVLVGDRGNEADLVAAAAMAAEVFGAAGQGGA